MENKIELIRNHQAEKKFGVEVFNVSYRLSNVSRKDGCEVCIICELKFVPDKKTRLHRMYISFAALDEENNLVGTDYKVIYEKEEYFVVDVFTINFNCHVKKENINAIKCYINNR